MYWVGSEVTQSFHPAGLKADVLPQQPWVMPVMMHDSGCDLHSRAKPSLSLGSPWIILPKRNVHQVRRFQDNVV